MTQPQDTDPPKPPPPPQQLSARRYLDLWEQNLDLIFTIGPQPAAPRRP